MTNNLSANPKNIDMMNYFIQSAEKNSKTEYETLETRYFKNYL